MGKMTNDFEVVDYEDIKRLNAEEWERVADAINLYVALKKAYEGDTEELSKQVYYVSHMRLGCLHKYIRYTDRRLNNFAIRMKRKYADSSVVSKESLSIGNSKIGGLVDRKAFTEQEIDDIIINFIYSFNKSFIELENNTYINIPNILSFKGDTDTHSNNKLMSFLLGTSGETGMFEVAILKTMEAKKASKRFMINGVSHKVNLNDMDEVRHDDIDTPKDSDGNQMMVDDLLGKEDVNYSKIDDTERVKGYEPTKEMAYIMENLERVLTKNQYEKFKMLVDIIEAGKVDVNDLFHEVTDQLIIVELGKVWFPEAKNNYVQPAVRSLLEGMRKRMKAAIELQGYGVDEDKEGLQGSFRRLEGHSMEDNRLYNEYDLDRWVHRDLQVDRFHSDIDVEFKNSDAFIPSVEMEKVERHEQSISDVIKKYQVSKKMVNNPNGLCRTYKIDLKNGKPLYTDDGMDQRVDKHCRQLMDWIRDGKIVFSVDDAKEGYMKLNTDKLHSVLYEDYVRLVKRDLIQMNDVVEMEIVRKYMNEEYFNVDNKYVLVGEEFVEYKDSQYTDKKNYNMNKYLEEIKFDEKVESNGDKVDEVKMVSVG